MVLDRRKDSMNPATEIVTVALNDNNTQGEYVCFEFYYYVK